MLGPGSQCCTWESVFRSPEYTSRRYQARSFNAMVVLRRLQVGELYDGCLDHVGEIDDGFPLRDLDVSPV